MGSEFLQGVVQVLLAHIQRVDGILEVVSRLSCVHFENLEFCIAQRRKEKGVVHGLGRHLAVNRLRHARERAR